MSAPHRGNGSRGRSAHRGNGSRGRSPHRGNGSRGRSPHQLGNSPRMLEVFEWIARERLRQRELQAQGRFKHTCDSREISGFQKLAILMEELGEVARQVCEMHHKSDFLMQSQALLKSELVQVAAVVVAWLETEEGK